MARPTLQLLKEKVKSILPPDLRRWARFQQHRIRVWPPVGMVRFGGLNRATPVSRAFGFDRGHCLDRYYIEDFLAAYASDIRGHVLEIADDEYTRRFGQHRVEQSSVLYVSGGNPKATIVADLTSADNILPNSFDCIILTQTLQFIYDTRAAIETLHRVLKPGGVLLATFPGISQISRYDMERWGDYWRFTTLSAQRLFEEQFPANSITVRARGNVFAAIALLHGLAQEDIDVRKLEYHDPDYEVIITVRAVRPSIES